MTKVEIEGVDVILECGCPKPLMGRHKHCPTCNSPPSAHELRNYNFSFHDGDIHCSLCGTYVRDYDAG